MGLGTRLRSTIPDLRRSFQRCPCRAASSSSSSSSSSGKSTRPSRDEIRTALADRVEKSFQHDEHGRSLKLDPVAKTVATAAGDLPISPVMDPAWMEAKQRFKARKSAKPLGEDKTSEFGRFRKRLRMNPYAHALATPWRACPVTLAAMPRYFLQDFRVVTNPETGEPWWVPGDELMEMSGEAAETAEATREEAETDEGLDALEADDRLADGMASSLDTHSTPGTGDGASTATTATATIPNTHFPTSGEPRARPTRPKRGQPSAPRGYVLARRQLVKDLGAPAEATRLAGQHVAMIVKRPALARAGIVPRLVWRQDMDALVLDLLRRRVVEGLLYFAKLRERDGRAYVRPCEGGWASINDDMRHRGCVLWYSADRRGDASRTATLAENGDGDGQMTRGQEIAAEMGSKIGVVAEGATKRDDDAPGQYATLDVPNAPHERKLPVHNLNWLLGEEHLARLRENTLFRDAQLFMVGKRRSIPLQLSLWKLHGYMADHCRA